MTTTLLLSRLHWPVTTLGHGRRIGIWLQGCTIHCKGCCSRDTWAFDDASRIPLVQVLEWIAHQPLAEIDGFTISGGEPFDQPEALSTLVHTLREQYCRNAEGDIVRDILVYSGHPWRTLTAKHAPILQYLDAVISEPFIEKRPPVTLYGSDNQHLHRLTALAQQRYPQTDSPTKTAPKIQTHFDGKILWMIGIPKRGDMQQLETRLAAAGVHFSNVSWRG